MMFRVSEADANQEEKGKRRKKEKAEEKEIKKKSKFDAPLFLCVVRATCVYVSGVSE